MTKNKSIQQKTTELTELVAWFDGDDFVLEQALDKFKEAEKLAQDIEKDLTTLRNDIEVVKKSFDSES
ncbi:exodeoxyribonuclease VII small subunit [compost metagenome]